MVSTRQVVGTTMAATGVGRPSRKGCPNHALDFKRELAAAACAPGVSVAKLALEHRLNANLLFKWRRQYRAGKFGAPDSAHSAASSRCELPVATQRSDAALSLLPVHASLPELDALTSSACIEVVFRSVTVRISGAPESASLRVVLDTLARHA